MFWYAGSCDEMPGAVRCCVRVPYFGMGRKVGGSNGRPNHVSSPFAALLRYWLLVWKRSMLPLFMVVR